MPRNSDNEKIINQVSFTGGEISPKLYYRIDTSEFEKSLRIATNCLPLPQGPIRRRNGTQYIADVKTHSATVKLIRYQYNQDTAFILEFGNLYIRFYVDNGQVQSGGSPYEIVTPYTTAQLSQIEYIQNGNIMYLTHPSHAPRILIRYADDDWELDILDLYPEPTYEAGYSPSATLTPAAITGTGINFTASAASFLGADVGRQIVNNADGETGRAAIISITSSTVAVCDILENFTDTNAIASGDWVMDLSPIADLEIDGVQAGSIANIRSEYPSGTLGNRLTITGITSADPAVVTSASHGLSNGQQVQIDDVVGMTEINDSTFTVNNVAANTFELKDEDSSSYVTYSSGGIARRVFTGESINAFRSADVGKYLLMNGGVCKIISVNAANDIDVEILKSLNSDDITGDWTLETATWDATRGYPRAIGFYEQRLIFGGTIAQPQTIWMSESGIFDGFGVGPDDEDAIEIDLVSNEVNQINWIASGRDLVIGTSGGEITVDSSSVSGLTPSTARQQPRTYHGSKIQQIVQIKDEILFIQGSERKIRTFRYNFDVDNYTGEDLTFLIEHLTPEGITEIAYSQEPDSILYAVTGDGNLLAGVYDRIKKVLGWSKITTDGYYENVQTITSGEQDQVWVVVQRKVNGSTVRYIEIFDNSDGTGDTDGFSDSYLTLSNALTITGITNANPAVVTSASHGLSNGDLVIIKDLEDPLSGDLDSDKTNLSSINQNTYTVAGVATNTFQLSGLNTTNYNAYGSGGNAYKKVTSISGLDHLEGKTVQVKVDGAVHPNETVSSGAITLDYPAGEVTVGLSYSTEISMLNIEYDIGLGSMQGQRARWVRPIVYVYKSGYPLVNNEFKPSRDGTMKMGQKVPLFSGYIEYAGLKWDNTTALTFTLSDPIPLQISGITGLINAGIK